MLDDAGSIALVFAAWGESKLLRLIEKAEASFLIRKQG